MFGRKKKEPKEVDVSDAISITIPVFFGGQQIGEVIHVKAKEINGLDHLEFWIRLTFGSGLESNMRDVLVNQGLYFGKPQ